MFISVAAAALDKYQWYQYQGKRILAFDNHNPKYDLDLEPQMKFGVRKYAGKHKLALLSEPDIVFTLTDADIKKVVRLSTGWSGKAKGKKLVAGVGGKDPKAPVSKVKTPTRPRGRKSTAAPGGARNKKYFPDFPVPPKVPDIFRLYTYFNNLLFKGECPEKIDIELAHDGQVRGQASCQFKGTHFAYGLRLSRDSMTDSARITNTVVHEMIHLLHFKRGREDRDSSYNEAGHGPLFIKEMNRLNKLGYNIQIQERNIEEAEIAIPEYVLVVHLKPNLSLPYRSTTDFRAQIPSLLEDIGGRIHSSRTLDRYVYGISKSNYASLCVPLTKKLQIDKTEKLQGRGPRDPHLVKILKSMAVIEKRKL